MLDIWMSGLARAGGVEAPLRRVEAQSAETPVNTPVVPAWPRLGRVWIRLAALVRDGRRIDPACAGA